MNAPQESPCLAERLRNVLRVLWPSFLLASAGEFLFFAVFDPEELHPFGVPLEADRMLVYTAVFFFFWALTAAASGLTLLLQRSSSEINCCNPACHQPRHANPPDQ